MWDVKLAKLSRYTNDWSFTLTMGCKGIWALIGAMELLRFTLTMWDVSYKYDRDENGRVLPNYVGCMSEFVCGRDYYKFYLYGM